MGYLHYEINKVHSSKNRGTTCGDVVDFYRTASSTVLVISDGLGSGIKANIAANMTISRIIKLMKQGHSQREAFASLMKTMNTNWGTEMPFAVFSVLKILNNGEATILSYEMPAPVFIGKREASVLKGRNMTIGKALISEYNCYVEPGEGILLFSDGVSQAGIGQAYSLGWDSKGVCEYSSELIQERVNNYEIPEYIHDMARRIWADSKGDDVTVAGLFCRPGKSVAVFSGPPLSKKDDGPTVRNFMLCEGSKVICGATTAKIFSKYSGRKLIVEQDDSSTVTPPAYFIEGIEHVTEGAVTLNQVYNLLDEPVGNIDDSSTVGKLLLLFNSADKITFFLGGSANIASEDILFRQQGILLRHKIIPLLADALRKKGKFVLIHKV